MKKETNQAPGEEKRIETMQVSFDLTDADLRKGHCTAIFNCWPPHTISGYAIQRQFDEIRNNGCKICGEHYFVSILFHLDYSTTASTALMGGLTMRI